MKKTLALTGERKVANSLAKVWGYVAAWREGGQGGREGGREGCSKQQREGL